jgi:hypothetical protein
MRKTTITFMNEIVCAMPQVLLDLGPFFSHLSVRTFCISASWTEGAKLLFIVPDSCFPGSLAIQRVEKNALGK